MFCYSSLSFEPQHDKANTMKCVPSKDSDQPGHEPSLIRVFADQSSDQTGQMPRLIQVFAERTGHFDGFVIHWLICLSLRDLFQFNADVLWTVYCKPCFATLKFN